MSTSLSKTHWAGKESCLFSAWGGCGGGTLGLLPWGFFCGPASGNVGNGAWVVSGLGKGGGFISELLGRGTGNTLVGAAGKEPGWLTEGPLVRFDALCWMKDLLATKINREFSLYHNKATQKSFCDHQHTFIGTRDLQCGLLRSQLLSWLWLAGALRLSLRLVVGLYRSVTRKCWRHVILCGWLSDWIRIDVVPHDSITVHLRFDNYCHPKVLRWCWAEIRSTAKIKQDLL